MDFTNLVLLIQQLSPYQIELFSTAVSLLETHTCEKSHEQFLLITRQFHDPLGQDIRLCVNGINPHDKTK